MKLITWNVNGIRAASKNGFGKWFSEQDADIVCVQEIKAFSEQLDDEQKHPSGYHSYWNSADKPGYSGTAIFSKTEPLSIRVGRDLDIPCAEGRVQVAEYPQLTVINTYFPNSQREHTRLGYKLEFCDSILQLCKKLVSDGKSIVLCGDYNIAHQEIDLKNPKTNMDNAGFLPEERAWMTKFLSSGFVDTFRRFEPSGGHYTWWSYRPGVREKNIGWRLDYHCVNEDFSDRLRSCVHQPMTRGSDHCPVVLELKE